MQLSPRLVSTTKENNTHYNNYTKKTTQYALSFYFKENLQL